VGLGPGGPGGHVLVRLVDGDGAQAVGLVSGVRSGPLMAVLLNQVAQEASQGAKDAIGARNR
jgi:hypothetical protein